MIVKMHYSLVMHPFIPFLVLAIKKPFVVFLWLGFLCGICVDVFCSYPFGVITSLYTFTALFLSFFKKRFSEKTGYIFFVNTFFTLAVFSVFYLLLLSILEKEMVCNFSSFITELTLYCPLDAFLGLTTLYLPLWLFEKLKKVSLRKKFFNKRKIRG